MPIGLLRQMNYLRSPHMDVYIETSALNYFRGIFTNEDALATRDLQTERGRRWTLSPVTIWELLLTRNLDRKEDLIGLAQHLLDKDLLPSHEEMLIKYLEQDCPLEEQQRPLISQSSMAITWRKLYEIPEKTFVYDEFGLRMKSRGIALVMRDLYKLLRNHRILLAPYTNDKIYNVTLEQLTSRLTFVKEAGELDDFHRNIYKIAIFYILFLLCAGVGFHPEAINQFWAQRKLTNTIERLMYILDEYETLVYRGPIAQMALMTLVQSAGKYSRGLFWDCLHAFYLTYTNIFFAEDNHFNQLRTALHDHPNAEKILKPSELPWVRHTRSIEQHSPIVI